MGTAQRKPHSALVAELLKRPGDFEFFRAAQLIEEDFNRGRRAGAARYVGHDHASSEVGLMFDVLPSLAFAQRPVIKVQTPKEGTRAFSMQVSFLGLIGPAGTLPVHYTEMIVERLHAKDTAFRDYLQTMQSRSVALFYRAWKKYRLAASYREGNFARGKTDPVLGVLLGLVGCLPRPSGEPIEAETLVQASYAGLFSDRRRSSNGLRAMLAGLIGCEVKVEQFVGQWIHIDRAACSRHGAGPGPGTPARLGDETVLGNRVWSVDARVRVVAGPLSRERFRGLWPGGAAVGYLWSAIGAYLGPLIQCDLTWELAPDAPGPICLGGDQRLGRDCWLGWSEQGAPDTRVSSPPWHTSNAG